MLPRDTHPDAWATQITVFRRMAPAERSRLALEMSDELDAVCASGIRARHPDYGDEDVTWALRRMRLGDDLFGGAYPGAPPRDP